MFTNDAEENIEGTWQLVGNTLKTTTKGLAGNASANGFKMSITGNREDIEEVTEVRIKLTKDKLVTETTDLKGTCGSGFVFVAVYDRM